MQKIKDNIYVETEYLGCNPSFVVTSNGIVLIDVPGLNPFEALAWKKEIAKHGEIVYIINTDHHNDHCLGNYFFSGDIIVHEGTMKKLFAEDKIEDLKAVEKLFNPSSQFLVEMLDRELYYIKKPKFTYNDKMTIYLGEEIFELTHIKGHTEYETIVYLPERKVIFTGDNVCTCGIPNLSESCPFEWLEALRMMEVKDIEVLVPGHGEIGDKNSIQKFRSELISLIDRVKEKIRKGFNKEEIVKEVSYVDNVHAGYPPAFVNSERASNFIKNSIRRIYDESAKR